jgi:hypothetical protein
MSRPEYEPSKFDRDKVEIWAASGMSQEAMAAALGIARGTLTKHFEVEMTTGAAKRQAKVMEALYSAAMRGNVSAQKAFLSGAGLAPTMRPPVPPAPPASDEPAADKLGKKESAVLAAQTAHEGTGWAGLVRH